MRLLLDTQVALWWLTASSRLSKASRELIGRSLCAVSVASVWEVGPKHGLGKLSVSPRTFRDEMRAAGAVLVALSEDHVLSAADVAPAHPDPFDRLLLGVALIESRQLLTADAALIALGEAVPELPITEV